MRIIGGKYKGKRLFTPASADIRPTGDRLRERLFNIIEHGDGPPLRGANIADIFAGTGAIGLEALSRGAQYVTFVEQNAAACRLIERNIENLKAGDYCRILRRDATHIPEAPAAYDYIFLDPPYGNGLIAPVLSALQSRQWRHDQTLVIVESDKAEMAAIPDGWTIIDQRAQGKTLLSMLKCTFK